MRLTLLLVFLLSLSSCDVILEALDGQDAGQDGAWTLVWSDEFEGDRIDSANWTHWVTGNPYSGEIQYYTDREENSRVEDGMLVIEARREEFTGPDGTREFTSARLNTRYKADWMYGRVDVRARLPIGKGLWPAIWMLPTQNTYGSWPSSGEIDIMEMVGSLPKVIFGSIHFGGPRPNNRFRTAAKNVSSGTFSDDFHVFSVIWEEDRIEWLLDGRPYATQTDWYTPGHDYPAPFDHPFYLLLNVAVGGDLVGYPDEDTVFPQRMEVDYVRVYQRD